MTSSERKSMFLPLAVLCLLFVVCGGLAGLLGSLIGTDTYPRLATSIMLSSLMQFAVPAAIWSRIYMPIAQTDKWRQTSAWQMFCVALLVYLCQPVIEWASYVNYNLTEGSSLSANLASLKEANNEFIIRALRFTTPLHWSVSIICIALLPAISEELFFRGALQRIFHSMSGNAHIAVIFAAIIFSLMHFDIEGLLPRFFLGCLLGTIYVITGSLLPGIFFHFLNNLMVVVSIGISDKPITEIINTPPTQPTTWIVILCLALSLMEVKNIEMIDGERFTGRKPKI